MFKGVGVLRVQGLILAVITNDEHCYPFTLRFHSLNKHIEPVLRVLVPTHQVPNQGLNGYITPKP